MKFNFPISKDLPKIVSKIKSSSSLVLTSSPGSGKTTCVPVELLNHFKNKIWVLEPRRVAAIGAADFASSLISSPLGKTVGYQVRNDNQSSDTETRLLYMTEGLFLKKMIQNPNLEGVDLVILDEFHERNLETDLSLGLLKELQSLERPDLKILIMSATLSTDPLIKYLENDTVVHSDSTVYPVETVFSKKPLNLNSFELNDRVIEVIKAIPASQNSILVFLPGVGEIKALKERVLNTFRDFEVQELHSRVPLLEQKKIIQFQDKKRIILSTNVAESSVTIDGLDTVIDSGLERRDQWNQEFDLQNLELCKISRFSAVQRRGRCHRQKPGICYRLWTEAEEKSLLESTPPSIQRVSLDSALLTLASFGIKNFKDFSWFEKPPEYSLNFANNKLKQLSLLDTENALSPRAKEISTLPLPLFESTLLHSFAEAGLSHEGSKICALLTEREPDFWEIRSDENSDILGKLEMFDKRASPGLKKMVQELERYTQSFRKKNMNQTKKVEEVLTSAYLKFICVKDRISDLKAKSAQGYFVENSCSVAKNSLAFFPIKLHLIEGKLKVRWAHAVELKALMPEMNQQAKIDSSLEFSDSSHSFQIIQQKYFYKLPLSQPIKKNPTNEELGNKLVEWSIVNWNQILKMNPALDQFWKRVEFWSEFQKTSENSHLRKALEFLLQNKTGIADLLNEDSHLSLLQLLSDEIRIGLDQFVPAAVKLKSKFVPIDYSQPGLLTISVQLHELYGSTGKFQIPLGPTDILIEILGPHRRPIQRTTDLTRFWNGSYGEIKKELKADYPRHFWPDKPESSPPIRMKKDAT